MKYFNEITHAQQVERWENALRVLMTLEPHVREKHWDMSTWGAMTECGTVACAAGHCGLDPWFRAQGFTLNFTPCDCGMEGCQWMRPHMTSAERFFGESGSRDIFYDSTARSVDTVIEEIKAYLQGLR